MKLSNQAIGAIMMALQESLMNQSDIVPVFQGFELMNSDDGLVVNNPPTVHATSVEVEVDTTNDAPAK